MAKKKMPLIWDLQPHTAAKHVILRDYLQAWIRIMTLGYNLDRRALYIDGFTGPGEYSKGEDGSPIIALKEAMAYCDQFPNLNPQLRFIFIEGDPERFDNLKRKVLDLFDEDHDEYEGRNFSFKPTDYENFTIYMYNGKFEDKMREILEYAKGKLAPCFAFVDPFGFKDIPYEIIKGIVENDRSEVFINFMYEDINRFLKMPSLQNAYQHLFGTDEWQDIVKNLEDYSPSQRRYFLHKLYKEQLHEAGLEYVISFEMKNEKNATEYFLYYGTNHIRGLEKMKDAMWKVDRSGAFTFSDYEAKKAQLEFVEFNEPDLSILADEIYDAFKGQRRNAEKVKEFVVTDTIFRKSVHSTAALKMLEKDGRIKEVLNRKKKGSYPDNSIIVFD